MTSSLTTPNARRVSVRRCQRAAEASTTATRAVVLDRCVRVQFTDPLTGELQQRLPAVVCASCADVVIGVAGVDHTGRCARCTRSKTKRPSARRSGAADAMTTVGHADGIRSGS